MSIALYETIIAIFGIGAVAVFAESWRDRVFLQKCCRLANCEALVGTPKSLLYSLTMSELRQIPIKTFARKKNTPSPKKIADCNDSETALITFTTGNTGAPKAANRTHGYLQQQFDVLRNEINTQATDIDFVTMPIVLLLNLGEGASSVAATFDAHKAHKTPLTLWTKALQHNAANKITCPPFAAVSLANYLLQNKIQLPQIKKIVSGGGPVFPADACRILQAFPQAELLVVYGSTEAEPISVIDGKRLAESTCEAGLPVGKVSKYCNLCIIAITNQNIQLAAGQTIDSISLPTGHTGEIVVSGQHVLQSYYKSDEAFRQNKIIDNGIVWHRTGDAGYCNAEDDLFLAGRKNALIERNGQWISPFIAEYELCQIAGIQKATIVEMAGEIVAVAETTPSANRKLLTQQMLNASCKPERVVYVRKIPMDKRHNSKVDYQQLIKSI